MRLRCDQPLRRDISDGGRLAGSYGALDSFDDRDGGDRVLHRDDEFPIVKKGCRELGQLSRKITCCSVVGGGPVHRVRKPVPALVEDRESLISNDNPGGAGCSDHFELCAKS